MHYIDQYIRDMYTVLTNKLIKEKLYMFFFYNYLCFKNVLGKLFGIKFTSQQFKKRTIHFDSFGAFFAIFTELFVYNIYYFETTKNEPFIIDCGANIWLAVFYFKYLFPQAHIECYEPDRETFALLQKNVATNWFDKVVLWNEAVSWETGELEFYSFADMEWWPWNTLEKSQVNFAHVNAYTVPVIQLSKKNYTVIDFLKVDIEWSEGKVFQDLQESKLIEQVDKISLEYHYDEELTNNSFSAILSVLENNKFHSIINTNILVWYYITKNKFSKWNNKYVLMIDSFRA